MAKYVAGIDAGTTGATVMIADLSGKVVGSAYREYPCIYPHPGWVEQDINLLWSEICTAAKQVIAKSGVDPADIASLGLSSQRGTFVGIDKNWNTLHNSIVWSDGRAGEQLQFVLDKIGGDRYHEISGVPPYSMWAYFKFKWIIDNQPELYDKAWKFVNGQEWLLHKFGSEAVFSDPASLTLNGMLDIKTLEWSKELCDLIGLSMDKLPPIGTPMTQVGTISKEASEASGFAVGMPICAGGGDQQCAAIGSGVVREGLAEITIGTASVMVAHVEKQRPDPKHLVLFGGHAIPHRWDMEGLAFATGVCLRWWRDTYAQAEADAAAKLGINVFKLIDMEASEAPVGCKGYMFFPFFSGQVTPSYHDNASGGSIGLSLIHDRSMMARAVLEGGAYELRMIVESMEEVLGRPFEAIRLSGGGAQSPLWNQIQADVYGRPVEKLRVSECTTLGAAILGAAGAGVFGSIEQAVESMVHTYGHVEPNMNNNAIYNDMFDCFKTTYHALKDAGIYSKISAVQAKHWG